MVNQVGFAAEKEKGKKRERKGRGNKARQRKLGRKIFEGWFVKQEEEFRTGSWLDSYLHEKEREIYSPY